MYICEESGLIEYESASEILNSDISTIWEDSENYYFKLKTEDIYDETIWIVNKKTNNVSQMDFIDFSWNKKKNAREINLVDVKLLNL